MYEEPPIQPGDTRPTMTVPVLDGGDGSRSGSRLFGALSLLGAVLFAAATIVLLLTNNSGTPAPVQNNDNGDAVAEVLATLTPTQPQPTGEALPEATSTPAIVFVPAEAIPTVDPSMLASLLNIAPQAASAGNPLAISRDALDPFTVIPDRPRNQVIEYTIERGDTVSDIALRFGLEQDSIAWANDQQSLWTLVPGDTLLIPPVDGVIHIATGDDTIAEITEYYSLTDPFAIIESDYNQLDGYTPEMQLPSGLKVFLPGATGLYIDWAPPVVVSEGSGTAGSPAGSNLVSFPGGPGSCSPQEPGPSVGWQRPLAGYSITRGYADWHQGIDLSAASGAPIYAANSGRVIFAGWSNYGYGFSVVLSHGPYQSLYGHMSSVNVSCGQVVSIGQVIGAVGSTGNSSGPHLHFEIMYGGVRGNPAATIGF